MRDPNFWIGHFFHAREGIDTFLIIFALGKVTFQDLETTFLLRLPEEVQPDHITYTA